MTNVSSQDNNDLSVKALPKWSSGVTAALLFVVGLSLSLNLTAVNWGQPGGHSWHADSIAGVRTVNEMGHLFGRWKHKYPRVQFLIVSVFYKPFLNRWAAEPVEIQLGDGTIRKTILDMERVSKLIIVSRVVTALMGAGAVIAVFLTARLLFRDNMAAFLAGLALAVTMNFVFYSHLGNVDVPCTFWVGWSLYWAVQASYSGKWRHFVLLGLFCALGVCTKEPVLGYVLGIGLAVWLGMIGKAIDSGKSFKKGLISVFNIKTIVAVIVALLCFAFLEDLLTAPASFFKRLDFWFKVGVDRYNMGFSGYWLFLWKTGRTFCYSLGWPLLTAVVASMVYCIFRYKWKSAYGILPILVFYVVVILRTRLNIPRYFIPGFTGLALLAGKGLSDFLRWKILPRLIRILAVGFVYVLSLLYCIGLDLELINDSRYDAEAWLLKHITRRDVVAVLSAPSYAPRIHTLGCGYRYVSARPKTAELLKKIRPHANYLILPEKEYTMKKVFDQDFLRELVGGKHGYHEVARFSNKYLYPQKTVFGIAGWPLERYNVISPEVIILKREW